MAEDDANANDLEEPVDYDQSRPQTAPPGKSSRPRSIQKPRPQTADNKKPKCRSRIDQLAIPNRRIILALYQNHADHLPKEKVEKIKVLLQELYAMTPEETEKYFEYLRKKSSESARRKDIKYMLKRLVKKRNKVKKKKKAYEFVNSLLIRGMEFSVKNSIPPLVSVRLRNLSNIILEQICDLRNVNIPNREDTDGCGIFLIQVADWMAIAIEHLYYGVQLKKNREMEKIEKEAKAREKEKTVKPVKPVKLVKEETKSDATPTETEKADEETAVLTDELLLSEME